MEEEFPYQPGQQLRRRELHEKFGGQQQGGISTPKAYPYVFLFTDSTENFGYKDGWVDGTFHYTGEGQKGNMRFVSGNKAIRDHLENNKQLHLFEKTKKAYVRYVGELVYQDFTFVERLDVDGRKRQAINFLLGEAKGTIERSGDPAWRSVRTVDLEELSFGQLREKAERRPDLPRDVKVRKQVFRERCTAVKQFAYKRAAGVCEACGADAPFVKEDGTPFLEIHHITRLSDGGPDKVENVAAVCPNCHREAHYATEKKRFKEALLLKVAEKNEGLV